MDERYKRIVKLLLPSCRKCGEIEVEKERDLCVRCAGDAGGGNDEPTDSEMKSMESRDLNENEGDK